MKKLALLLTVLTLAFPAQAVEIGDIYYSNKSFSSTPVDGLLPIGIVWQVNDAGNGGWNNRDPKTGNEPKPTAVCT